MLKVAAMYRYLSSCKRVIDTLLENDVRLIPTI